MSYDEIPLTRQMHLLAMMQECKQDVQCLSSVEDHAENEHEIAFVKNYKDRPHGEIEKAANAVHDRYMHGNAPV